MRERFSFLTDLEPDEAKLLDDQTSHREVALHNRLREGAQSRAHTVQR